MLAGLVHLPLPVIAAFAVMTIAGHNLFDAVRPDQLGPLGPLWTVLHTRGPLTLTPSVTLFVHYPLVPWIGVMAAGYVFGAVFLLNRPRRRTTMLGLARAWSCSSSRCELRTSMATRIPGRRGKTRCSPCCRS